MRKAEGGSSEIRPRQQQLVLVAIIVICCREKMEWSPKNKNKKRTALVFHSSSHSARFRRGSCKGCWRRKRSDRPGCLRTERGLDRAAAASPRSIEAHHQKKKKEPTVAEHHLRPTPPTPPPSSDPSSPAHTREPCVQTLFVLSTARHIDATRLLHTTLGEPTAAQPSIFQLQGDPLHLSSKGIQRTK